MGALRAGHGPIHALHVAHQEIPRRRGAQAARGCARGWLPGPREQKAPEGAEAGGHRRRRQEVRDSKARQAPGDRRSLQRAQAGRQELSRRQHARLPLRVSPGVAAVRIGNRPRGGQEVPLRLCPRVRHGGEGTDGRGPARRGHAGGRCRSRRGAGVGDGRVGVGS